MSRRINLFVKLSLLGFVLIGCNAGSAPADSPVENPPTREEYVSETAAPTGQPAQTPTIVAEVEGFQPTSSPLFEQSYRANPISDRDYSQYEIVTLLPPDAIPALSFPAFYRAERAEREYLPDEIVIGVDFNGDARAYPVELLSRHEIVNDTVGGIHLAVTW